MSEKLAKLPSGGYFRECCPSWNSTHVAPVYNRGVVVFWECSHCSQPHWFNESNQWADRPLCQFCDKPLTTLSERKENVCLNCQHGIFP